MAGKEKILFVSLLLFAVFLRLYNLEGRLTFDWDQENFSWQAKQLVIDHKLTLIGAEQSIGGLHLGPFYNYVLDFFFFIFRMDPIAGGVTAIIFGVLTMLTLFFVGNRLFGKRVGYLALIIYSFSFLMIRWDTIFWNVNPLYALSLLSVYSLYRSLSEEKYLVLLGISLGLGFHTHLTTILLCILSFVVLLYQRPKFKPKIIVTSFIVFLFTLSPLIIFEFRHNFHNIRQSLGILSAAQNSLPAEKFKFLTMANLIKDQLFSFVTFSMPNTLKSIMTLFCWLIIFFARFFARENRRFIDIELILILIVFLVFSIYPGHVTEYYLGVLIPGGIIICSFMIDLLLKKGRLWRALALVILMVFIAFNLNGWFRFEKVMSLRDKKEAIQYIIQKNDNKPFRLSITALPGNDSGYKYLLWYYRAKTTEDLKDPVYTIVAPSGAYGIKPLKEFHGVGIVWNEVFLE